jgi:hypothetical protein
MTTPSSTAVLKVFSFKPADIVKQLNLLRPIYSKSTNYGHFGKIDDRPHLGKHRQSRGPQESSEVIRRCFKQSSKPRSEPARLFLAHTQIKKAVEQQKR